MKTKKFFIVGLLIILPFFGAKTAKASTATDHPYWIYAPSISLSSPIQNVGSNSKGEMVVPSGKSNHVGWYKDGVVPGETGTAVLDAHVFAAFKNLSRLSTGSDIFIYMKSGKILHFITVASNLYSLSNLSPYTLFAPTMAKQINLITCAGSLTPDHMTYDHRLIVSAKLV